MSEPWIHVEWLHSSHLKYDAFALPVQLLYVGGPLSYRPLDKSKNRRDKCMSFLQRGYQQFHITLHHPSDTWLDNSFAFSCKRQVIWWQWQTKSSDSDSFFGGNLCSKKVNFIMNAREWTYKYKRRYKINDHLPSSHSDSLSFVHLYHRICPCNLDQLLDFADRLIDLIEARRHTCVRTERKFDILPTGV